ncbi:SpoIIE family protein phosphatase [Kineococcus sp. NUM-3379]
MGGATAAGGWPAPRLPHAGLGAAAVLRRGGAGRAGGVRRAVRAGGGAHRAAGDRAPPRQRHPHPRRDAPALDADGRAAAGPPADRGALPPGGVRGARRRRLVRRVPRPGRLHHARRRGRHRPRPRGGGAAQAAVVQRRAPAAAAAGAGRACLLEQPGDVLLGLAPELSRTEHVTTLHPGGTVVLYTDGLVERREESPEVSLRRLRDTAARVAELPLEALGDALPAEPAPDPDDDIAIVALRAHPEDAPRPDAPRPGA